MAKQFSVERGWFLLGCVVLIACGSEDAAPGVQQSWDNVCIDSDGDGFGYQCAAGDDCDDDDAKVQVDCGACRKPAEGCACEVDAEPVDCRLPYTRDSQGALLCHTGTRYCRDGAWSACEGVVSFVAPGPLQTLGTQGLIDPSVPPVVCDPCNPGCFRVEDTLDNGAVPDAGLAAADAGSNVVIATNGGVTLEREVNPIVYETLLDEATCRTNDDDCDGLPAPFDLDPAAAPAGATHRSIFLDLPPGLEGSQRFATKLSVRALDVYFFVDTTGSMVEELSALVSSFAAGNYFASGGSDITCSDADQDGAPDEYRKDAGVAGNIACLVRDARFGAGFFRDIPFRGPFTQNPYAEVAPWDTELFENRHDISSDVESVASTLAGFTTRSNYNTPEGSMQGLWALATGSELYAGWDRPGIPARRGCPAGTYGYPCFREGALPIILQLTDAPMQSGPDTAARSSTSPNTPANCLSNAFLDGFTTRCAPLHYDNGVLGALRSGTESTYRALTTSAEAVASAEPVGTIDGKLITYVGDTRQMSADVTYASVGTCPSQGWFSSDQTAPDAVFRFRVATAGTYVLSTRGSRFDTVLMLLGANASGAPTSVLACSDDAVYRSEPDERGFFAELELNLPAGEYLLVLKGYASGDMAAGMFQVSFGRRALQTAGTFKAQRWLGPLNDGQNGVRQVLQDHAIRVITLQSGSDSYAREQALALASATQATAGGVPLRGSLGSDGSNLGAEAVRVVRELLAGLRMDVGLRWLQAPDNPEPDFELHVEALPQSGDGCSGAIDADGDTVLDTHVDCVPGATPQFRVTFRNPPGAGAVPSNPADPTGQGGYRTTLQVLGDGKQLLDEVPVYLVPADVLPDLVPSPFLDSGEYEQEVRADACADDEGPTWGQLSWEADIPPDTSLTFEACAAESADTLPSCTFHEVVTLSPGGACATTADCGGTGYCDVSNVCHEVVGATCGDDTDCGVGGICLDLGSAKVCTSAQPSIDLKPAAREDMQGRRFARVRARLVPSADRTQAPTLLRWTLDYSCAPTE